MLSVSKRFNGNAYKRAMAVVSVDIIIYKCEALLWFQPQQSNDEQMRIMKHDDIEHTVDKEI